MASGQGDLDVERFRYYIAQDYVYLIDYARVLALGAARAPQLEVMSWFAGLLDETLNTEMELHRGYCAQFGITREELAATKASADHRGLHLVPGAGGFAGQLRRAGRVPVALPVGLLGDRRVPGPAGARRPTRRSMLSGWACTRRRSFATWPCTCVR